MFGPMDKTWQRKPVAVKMCDRGNMWQRKHVAEETNIWQRRDNYFMANQKAENRRMPAVS